MHVDTLYLSASQLHYPCMHSLLRVYVCVCVALAQRNAGLPVGLGDLLGGHIK